MANPTYTTDEELRTFLSDLGVDLRTDHAPETAVIAAIRYASGRVYFHLGAYDATALQSSDWVAYCALVLAAAHLSRNRYNPPGLADMEAQILAELELVRSGKAVVPGVAAGKGGAPTVTNQRVTLDRYPSIRTERPRSTTGQGSVRRVDPTADAIDSG